MNRNGRADQGEPARDGESTRAAAAEFLRTRVAVDGNWRSRVGLARWVEATAGLSPRKHADGHDTPLLPALRRRRLVSRGAPGVSRACVGAKPPRPRLDEFLRLRRADRLRHVRRVLSGAAGLAAVE